MVNSSRDMKTTIIILSSERAQEKGGANSGKIIHISEDTIMRIKSLLLQKFLRDRVMT